MRQVIVAVLVVVAVSGCRDESRCERTARRVVECRLGPEDAKDGELAIEFERDRCEKAFGDPNATYYLDESARVESKCADQAATCEAWHACVAAWERAQEGHPANGYPPPN